MGKSGTIAVNYKPQYHGSRHILAFL